MTEQKKELTDWFYKWFDSKKIRSEEDLAKALIQRYPQILAEKVLDDIPNNETIKDFSSHFFSCALKSKHIQVFIREVVS